MSRSHSTLFLALKPIVKRIPPLRGLYVALSRVRSEIKILKHSLDNDLVSGGLRPKRKASVRGRRQSIPTYPTRLSANGGFPGLAEWLKSEGVRYNEGGHTLYVPPQEGLVSTLGSFVGIYPSDAGFKILKQLKGPLEGRYISDYRRFSLVQSLVTGTAVNNVIGANFLHLFGLGPRLYDLVQLSAGDKNLTVFVVQHVAGSEPSTEECFEFLNQLESVISSRRLALNMPNWREHPDFECPSCSGNLIKAADNGKSRYVDFQNFLPPDYDGVLASLISAAKADLHFGNEYVVRGGKYLYQSIPDMGGKGKRDTDVRWNVIQQLLGAAGVALDGRLVLDIGCNSGMILAQSLVEGAAWGLGWDRTQVVNHAQRILWALGYTRFDLSGSDLSLHYPMQDDVPQRLHPLLSDSVVFYLAMYNHIGFMKALGRVPWAALVYEGHEGDSLEALPLRLAELQKVVGFSVVDAREYRDGDSGTRPIAILLRN